VARVDIVRRHHTQLLTVRRQAAVAVAAAWAVNGGPTDTNLARFTATAVPIVGGAQRRTINLMGAYMAALLTGRPGTTVPMDTNSILAGTRNGVDLATVYARPVIQLRVLLSEGVVYADAFNRAGRRAAVAAETDVVLANRDAATAVMAGEPRIERFERVLSATACDLCAGAAGETYSSDDPLPLHAGCDCDVAPIVDGDNPAAGINDVVEAADPNVTDTVTNPDGVTRTLEVVVEDHGELGPVLVDKAHTFNTL